MGCAGIRPSRPIRSIENSNHEQGLCFDAHFLAEAPVHFASSLLLRGFPRWGRPQIFSLPTYQRANGILPVDSLLMTSRARGLFVCLFSVLFLNFFTACFLYTLFSSCFPPRKAPIFPWIWGQLDRRFFRTRQEIFSNSTGDFSNSTGDFFELDRRFFQLDRRFFRTRQEIFPTRQDCKNIAVKLLSFNQIAKMSKNLRYTIVRGD